MKIHRAKAVISGSRSTSTNHVFSVVAASLAHIDPLQVFASHSLGIPGAQAEVVVDGQSYQHDLTPDNANRVCRLDVPLERNPYQMDPSNASTGRFALTANRFSDASQEYIDSLAVQQMKPSSPVTQLRPGRCDTSSPVAQTLVGKVLDLPDPPTTGNSVSVELPRSCRSSDYVVALIRTSDNSIISVVPTTSSGAVSIMQTVLAGPSREKTSSRSLHSKRSHRSSGEASAKESHSATSAKINKITGQLKKLLEAENNEVSASNAGSNCSKPLETSEASEKSVSRHSKHASEKSVIRQSKKGIRNLSARSLGQPSEKSTSYDAKLAQKESVDGPLNLQSDKSGVAKVNNIQTKG